MNVHLVIVDTGVGGRRVVGVYDTREEALSRARLEGMHYPSHVQTHEVKRKLRTPPPSIEKFEVG